MFLLWGHHGQTAARPAEACTVFTSHPPRPPAPAPTLTPRRGDGRRTFQRACLPRGGPAPACRQGMVPGSRCAHGNLPLSRTRRAEHFRVLHVVFKDQRQSTHRHGEYSRTAKCAGVSARVCAGVREHMWGARVCRSRAENRPGGLRDVVQGGGQVVPPRALLWVGSTPPRPHSPTQTRRTRKNKVRASSGRQLSVTWSPGPGVPCVPPREDSSRTAGGKARAGAGHLPAGGGGCGQQQQGDPVVCRARADLHHLPGGAGHAPAVLGLGRHFLHHAAHPGDRQRRE